MKNKKGLKELSVAVSLSGGHYSSSNHTQLGGLTAALIHALHEAGVKPVKVLAAGILHARTDEGVPTTAWHLKVAVEEGKAVDVADWLSSQKVVFLS